MPITMGFVTGLHSLVITLKLMLLPDVSRRYVPMDTLGGAMLGERVANQVVLKALVGAIGGVGSDAHVDRLVDLVGALVPHNLMTIVRYSATQRPEFVSHRNFSDAMVRKYLDNYYVYDPFYAHWRKHQQPGVYPLSKLRGKVQGLGLYIADFLSQSVISDEVGVLLNDGPGWCLGIFLDRKKGSFTTAEIARLETRFTVFAAIHDCDIKSRTSNFRRTAQAPSLGREPLAQSATLLPAVLWPELSGRERELVKLILAGHPTVGIARKLGITAGTVKNHRLHIYKKLDITTERELFLQYIERGPSDA